MKTFCSTLLCLAALCALLAGCQPTVPPGLTEADRQAIRQTTERIAKIANESADWKTYAELYYAENAVVNPPNAPPVKGRDAIIAMLKSEPAPTDFRFEQVEVDGVGNIAYVYGKYSMVLNVPGMAPIPDKGKYIEVWKRQGDGSWKVIFDIFNSDLPLPAPEKK